MIQAAIVRPRQALRNALEESLPHVLLGQLAHSTSSDRLEVIGEALVHVKVLWVKVGKAEMKHLVGHHPIVREVRRLCFGSERHADKPAVIGDATAYAFAWCKTQFDCDALDRETAEVIGYRDRRAVHPIQDHLRR